jgi:uncharacterized membrane-anchored protein YjiN (DUF445 family)
MALGALGLSGILLTCCQMMLPGDASWVVLLKSGALAGIAGGLADWFAVTAIFRGLPGRRRCMLPNTNILIKRRDQIEQALLNLLTGKVLNQESLKDYFRQEPPLTILIRELAKPGNGSVRILAHLLADVARQLQTGKMADQLAELLRQARLAEGVAEQAAGLLRYLAQEERLDRLLEWLLKHLHDLCRQPTMRDLIASALQQALTAYQGRDLAKRVVVWVSRNRLTPDFLLGFLAQQGSEARWRETLRNRLSGEMRALANDRARLEKILGRIMTPLTEAKTLTEILHGALRKVADESSGSAERVIEHVLEWLTKNKLPTPLERTIGNVLPEWIHRVDLRAEFSKRLQGYDNEQLTDLVREKVATDLHWIRVSGTVIGFIVGAALAGVVEGIDWLQSR